LTKQVADTGVITTISGKLVTILLESTDNCKDCGIRFLCSPGSDKVKIITLENSINAEVGEKVKVSEFSNILIKLSLLQYGLPLLGFLLGIIVSTFIAIPWKPIELYQFLCGVFGFGIAGILSYLIIKRMARNPYKYFNLEKI